jgi:hypothetical protein
MARTIDYWYQQVMAQKNATAALNGLNSTSKTADFNLWAFIVATVMMVLDNLFDLHKSDVDTALTLQLAHKTTWYRQLLLNFQYGQNTIADSDQYANTGLTSSQIAAQKIISQAAVTEINGELRCKVVKSVAGVFTQLNSGEKAAVNAYLAKQKDAGVRILNDSVDSLPADQLKLNIDIWYDPLTLRSDGSRIDGTANTPVPDAVQVYLGNLKFNGEYANSLLKSQLQTVSGVVFAVIKLAQAQYGLFPFTAIDEIYEPDPGYLNIPTGGLIINYRPYV